MHRLAEVQAVRSVGAIDGDYVEKYVGVEPFYVQDVTKYQDETTVPDICEVPPLLERVNTENRDKSVDSIRTNKFHETVWLVTVAESRAVPGYPARCKMLFETVNGINLLVLAVILSLVNGSKLLVSVRNIRAGPGQYSRKFNDIIESVGPAAQTENQVPRVIILCGRWWNSRRRVLCYSTKSLWKASVFPLPLLPHLK